MHCFSLDMITCLNCIDKRGHDIVDLKKKLLGIIWILNHEIVVLESEKQFIFD